MRKSITNPDHNLLGKRVMYRYHGKSVVGVCIAVFDNELWVELEDGSDLQRNYKSWEILE